MESSMMFIGDSDGREQALASCEYNYLPEFCAMENVSGPFYEVHLPEFDSLTNLDITDLDNYVHSNEPEAEKVSVAASYPPGGDQFVKQYFLKQLETPTTLLSPTSVSTVDSLVGQRSDFSEPLDVYVTDESATADILTDDEQYEDSNPASVDAVPASITLAYRHLRESNMEAVRRYQARMRVHKDKKKLEKRKIKLLGQVSSLEVMVAKLSYMITSAKTGVIPEMTADDAAELERLISKKFKFSKKREELVTQEKTEFAHSAHSEYRAFPEENNESTSRWHKNREVQEQAELEDRNFELRTDILVLEVQIDWCRKRIPSPFLESTISVEPVTSSADLLETTPAEEIQEVDEKEAEVTNAPSVELEAPELEAVAASHQPPSGGIEMEENGMKSTCRRGRKKISTVSTASESTSLEKREYVMLTRGRKTPLKLSQQQSAAVQEMRFKKEAARYEKWKKGRKSTTVDLSYEAYREHRDRINASQNAHRKRALAAMSPAAIEEKRAADRRYYVKRRARILQELKQERMKNTEIPRNIDQDDDEGPSSAEQFTSAAVSSPSPPPSPKRRQTQSQKLKARETSRSEAETSLSSRPEVISIVR